MVFWSGNFVVGRAVHDIVPPIGLAFWRWTLGFLLVLGFAAPHLRRDAPALRAAAPELLLLSLLGVAAFNTMVYIALGHTTVVNGVLLQSTMPLIILFFSFLIFRERTRPVEFAGLLISLAGVAAIVARGSLETLLAVELNPGDAWILVAVACYALYSALLRTRPAVHPLSFIAATFGLGALMLLPLYLWEHLTRDALRLNLPTLAAVLYVGIFPSLIAYLCFNRGVELVGANRAGQFLHLMPVFGSVLAFVFLGETLRPYHLLGVALIGTGLVVAGQGRKPPPAPAPVAASPVQPR